MALTLHFQGDLALLLRAGFRGSSLVRYELERRASIKDIIESLGIPHPEVGGLKAQGREISFAYLPEPGEEIEVLPLPVPVDVRRPTLLRPSPLDAIRFQVDINVGKLAALLRMAGLDTAYEPDLADVALADTAAREGRILLSRDTTLMKRKQVEFGHLVRAQEPGAQLAEVVRLYGLADSLQPFSRCLRCNTPLEPVAKEAILDRLLPLTRKYYDSFQQCTQCDKIYWPGSHRDRMEEYLALMQRQRRDDDHGG